INGGNSGGPLLDSAGAVVGVNTWRSEGKADRNVYFALSAIHLPALIAAKQREPVTFAVAVKKYGRERAPGSDLPFKIPHIAIVERTTAQEVATAAKALELGAAQKCSHCIGKGTIVVTVKTGERREGWMTYPIMEDQQ